MVVYHDYRPKEWNELKKQSRQELANWYREERKRNPAMARLFYKRYKECERKMLELVYGTTTQTKS